MQTMTSSTTLAFFVTCLLRVSFFRIFRVQKEICILQLILKARISRTGGKNPTISDRPPV